MGVFDQFFEFGIRPNAPRHHGPTVEACGTGPDGSGGAFQLAIIEVDDQGMCFERERRMAELDACLRALKGRMPVIVAFVHGWKHDASATDCNLRSFRQTLAALAGRMPDHPVLGVYLAWPGASLVGNRILQQLSFPGRHRAAQRVATGSAREVLGRLKAFRNEGDGTHPHGAVLVVAGHSFGGLIVFTALAQSLIEAAATHPDELVPSFGDLVVLINPAFSAVSYMPIPAIATHRTYVAEQSPICVSVTATNDWATGFFFPLGNLPRLLHERWRGRRQRQALTRTMGHLPWLRTHTLTRAGPDGPVVATNTDDRPLDPFWVASATPDVIDGHNGITGAPFREFIAQLVARRTRDAMARRRN